MSDSTAATAPEQADVADIKRAAAGKWPSILSTLGGIPAEILDGKHHPCIKCGGTDRFRMIDPEAGALYCNGCFSSENGDGLAALQWLTGRPFKEVAAMLADHLGLQNGNGHTNGKAKKKAADAETLAKGIESIGNVGQMQETLLGMYTAAKPPISAQGVRQCGGTLVRWHENRCIQLDGRAPIDSPIPTAVVLLRIEGVPFPAVGKIGERKTHTVKGSVNSWLASGDVAAAEIILDLEGVTDLLAAVSAGLPPGWVAVTNTAGAKARGKLPRPWAKGKRVVVAGDADEPGEEGKRRSAAAYHKAGAEVLLGQLPYPIEKDHGRDIRDWLNDGHKPHELPTVAVTADEAAAWTKKASMTENGRAIVIGTDESRVIDEAIKALATQGNIFQRGGVLVQVVESAEPLKGIARPKDAPRIATMRFARIRELLADAAAWFRPAGEGELEQCHPPDWTIKALDARGQWQGIRRLEAVVESPILRADGTILQTPGYDESTGIIFRPEDTFPAIPEKPSQADATRAGKMLLEVIEDFPFGTDAHRAAWLAGVLTPLARYAFHGPAPLFLNDGNVRGCGKSLLTDATSIITVGREMARMSLPRDDDETRKRITALAMAGEPEILIDNLPPGGFGSPSLDAALTATSWSDRILGQSAMVSGVPLYAVWFATGNNVILVGDTARRVVHIRLESPEENPEERSGFHHADLLAWVRRERPRLTAAAVTILSAYCAAGRPDMRLTPWGSFEGWSNLVRQAVVWCGLPDPGSTRTELASQADRDAVALRQLIAGWEEMDAAGTGMTVAIALRELAEHPTRYDALRAALSELAPPRDGKTLNTRSVGMKLHHLRRRVVGGRYLDQRTEHNTAVWFIGGSSGSRGTILDSARTGARAHARTHARENREATDISPPTPPSPTVDPADCFHTDVAESPTHDGYINRTCRNCGANLPCQKSRI